MSFSTKIVITLKCFFLIRSSTQTCHRIKFWKRNAKVGHEIKVDKIQLTSRWKHIVHKNKYCFLCTYIYSLAYYMDKLFHCKICWNHIFANPKWSWSIRLQSKWIIDLYLLFDEIYFFCKSNYIIIVKYLDTCHRLF